MPSPDHTPEYAKPKIEMLNLRSAPIFGRLLMAIRNAKESDFSVYNPDHAIKLKTEILQKPRQELHLLIKEFLNDAKIRKQNMDSKINSFTEPKINPDPSKQIVSSLRDQEIRQLIRSKDLNERKLMVEDELKAGNSEILTAISSSPDSLIPSKTLIKYREDFAYFKDPDLNEYKRQVDQLETIIRKECGKLNADHTEILLENDLEDPISLEQHFETFPPKDDNDKRLSNAMLNRQKHNAEFQKNRNNFDGKNSGMNL
jgi:hypothetical protein